MGKDAGAALGWDEVLEAERAALGVSSDEKRPLWGLCLSGGGIRSATLGLGLLQGLAESGWLRRFDYLSTVSGGGYIGAWLSAWIQRAGRGEVFSQLRSDAPESPVPIRHLRAYSQYLTPRAGVAAFDTWTLVATVGRHLLWTWWAFVPLLLAVVLAPRVALEAARSVWPNASAVCVTWAPAAALLALFVVLAAAPRARTPRWGASLLLAAVAWFTGCGLTLALPAWLLGVSSAAVRHVLAVALSAVAALSGWMGARAASRSASTPARPAASANLAEALAVRCGPVLFTAGLAVALATILLARVPLAATVPALLGMVLMAWLCGRSLDVNASSLQGLYRARLVRAYLPEGDRPLADLAGQRPLPIFNMTLNLTAHPRLRWQQRRAALFTATPLHCGSPLTGWRGTSEYAGGLSVGEAMATAGAALNPAMGQHSSPLVAFVMTLFNLRLGAWWGNPAASSWRRSRPRAGLLWLVREALGRADARGPYVNLSDGGHFENLGLYALVERRCRLVVALDADCDPGLAFADLGNAVEKIRVDLGVPVEFEAAELAAVGRRERRWARARIRYSAVTPGATDGELIYLKPLLLGDEAPDVLGYARAHAAFPHESTRDQWFSETQMESYRMLGLEMARDLTHPCGRVVAPGAQAQAEGYGGDAALGMGAGSGGGLGAGGV